MVPRNSEDLVLKEKLLHLDIFSVFETIQTMCYSTLYPPRFLLLEVELHSNYGIIFLKYSKIANVAK